MRINLKLLLSVLLVGVGVTTLSYWTKCGENSLPRAREDIWRNRQQIDEYSSDVYDKPQDEEKSGRDIDCLINEEATISCRQYGGEVYIPFSFIHKYFEVYGRLVKHEGYDRFEWQHSYSKVYFPKKKYDPHGVFLWFENYNVEVRDRVKCVSGIEGVPISSQWDSRGYFYPIQIAQFGLSHFSKNLTEPPSTVVSLENGSATHKAKWRLPANTQNVIFRRVLDDTVGRKVLEFRTGATPGASLSLHDDLPYTTLRFEVLFTSNGSLTVVLENASDRTRYTVRYVTSDIILANHENEILYGLGGNRTGWYHVTRDLIVDLQKGLALHANRKAPRPRSLRVRKIIIRGSGYIGSVNLASSAHLAHFYSAADWLIRHQDDKGGWPIKVTRKLSNGMLELAPGWYSAMAQGQAMSLLTRAFGVTSDLKYLEAALKGVHLFKVRSENHGVMTTFLGKYVWYEEYPTVPSSFVLNGFIYSLFGLYDVYQTCTHEDCREAGKLFDEGIISLKKMLPLFDTGSGSIYDLRHLSLGVAPNLARWDYHTTHINQLLFLNTVHDDSILKSTAERWMGYMKGKRASHN
uniref:heparosan-N-sulfate-glucuronate 5-epimerase n=1 Tax=Hadrurus spadix TaxID=141984 RepID=A0A1W7RAK8_9SCOR